MKREGLLILLLLLLTVACSEKKHDHRGRHPLVEWNGHFLYQEDIDAVVPVALSGDDSAKLARAYIDKWLMDEMFYDKANDNVSGMDEIERLVENYRKDLIMYTYQQKLMREKVDESCSDDSLKNFYENNRHLFLLDRPLIKGLFLKVPLSSPDLSKVRRWCRDTLQSSVDKVEKYSIRHAAKYEYFYNKWLPLNEVAAWLPENTEDLNSRIGRSGSIELRDSSYVYFLNVSAHLKAGDLAPFPYAIPKIREVVIDRERTAFIEQMKRELLEKAEKRGKVKYYK